MLDNMQLIINCQKFIINCIAPIIKTDKVGGGITCMLCGGSRKSAERFNGSILSMRNIEELRAFLKILLHTSCAEDSS